MRSQFKHKRPNPEKDSILGEYGLGVDSDEENDSKKSENFSKSETNKNRKFLEFDVRRRNRDLLKKEDKEKKD